MDSSTLDFLRTADSAFCVTDTAEMFDRISLQWEREGFSFTKLRITPLDPVFAFSPLGVDTQEAINRFYDFLCTILRTDGSRDAQLESFTKKTLSSLYLMTDVPTLGMLYEVFRDDGVTQLTPEEKLNFYTFMVSPLAKHFNTEHRIDFSAFNACVIDISVVLGFIGEDRDFWTSVFTKAIASCILDARVKCGLVSHVFNMTSTT